MGKVFAVGDLNVDIFTYADSFPQFGTEAHSSAINCAIGGNAANFSLALSSLGQKTTLISAIGGDIFSKFILGELSRYNVGTLLHKVRGANGVSNIFVRKDGERAIVSGKGALLSLSSALIEKNLIRRISRGDIVLFGGYFHLPSVAKGFPRLLRKIKSKGALIFFDACYDEYGKWKIGDFTKYVDVFFLNELELAQMARTKVVRAGVKRLLQSGVKSVVLKRGAKGAEYYSQRAYASSPAVNVRALNDTGAGDFFNAGFVYAFLRGFSWQNCLLCANFVAGKKISKKEYVAPRRAELEEYLRGRNLVQMEKVGNYSALSRAAAREIISQVNSKNDSVISIAAGKTPILLYRYLVQSFKRGEVNFSKVRFIEMDEYLGVENPRDSFGFSLRKKLLENANFARKNVFLFNPYAKDVRRECRRMEKVVRSRGIDIMILGIGENAHVAFNQPGTKFTSGVGVVKISNSLIRSRIKDFAGKPPQKAYTLGLSNIMSARKIVLIANGGKKAVAIANSFSKKPSEKFPASILQRHGNARVIVDSRAGRLIK